jgi:hypothetical protein
MILVSQLVFQIRNIYVKKLLMKWNYKETLKGFMDFFQVITTGVSEGRLSRGTWVSPCISAKFVRNLDSLLACTVCCTCILLL